MPFSPWDKSALRHTNGRTVCATHRLIAYDHETLAAVAYSAKHARWDRIVPPSPKTLTAKLQWDRLSFLALPDNTHVLYDQDGALWRCADGGVWTPLGTPRGGPGSMIDKRVALGWDPHKERIVAYGGLRSNLTWTWTPQDGWQPLRSTENPIPGPGSMVSTPRGLFLLRMDELWRLVGDGWECVIAAGIWSAAAVPSWEVEEYRLGLVYDPRRDLLLSTLGLGFEDDLFGDDRTYHLAVLDKNDWRVVAEFPHQAERVGYMNQDLAICPQSDALWKITENGGAQWPLSTLDLPQNGRLPTVRRPSRSQMQDPPDDRVTVSLSLQPDPTAPEVRVPRATLQIPDEMRLIAIFPHRAEMGCSRWFAALLIGDLDQHTSRVRLSSPISLLYDQYENTVILPMSVWEGEAPLRWVRQEGSDEVFQPMKWVPFRELPPAETESWDELPKYNSLPDQDKAYGTKIGGFACYIQECNENDARVSIQLASDHFLFGDCGCVYVDLYEGGGSYTSETH